MFNSRPSFEKYALLDHFFKQRLEIDVHYSLIVVLMFLVTDCFPNFTHLTFRLELSVVICQFMLKFLHDGKKLRNHFPNLVFFFFYSNTAQRKNSEIDVSRSFTAKILSFRKKNLLQS